MGREKHCKQISLACVGSALSVLTIRFAPAHGVCAFLVYTAQAPGCSTGELSKAAPGFCVLPRSKLLSFVFLSTPQRHRFGLACVLCPSQVRAAQASRCLASTHYPCGKCILSPPLSQPLGFLCVKWEHCLRQVCRVSPLGS